MLVHCRMQCLLTRYRRRNLHLAVDPFICCGGVCVSPIFECNAHEPIACMHIQSCLQRLCLCTYQMNAFLHVDDAFRKHIKCGNLVVVLPAHMAGNTLGRSSDINALSTPLLPSSQASTPVVADLNMRLVCFMNSISSTNHHH